MDTILIVNSKKKVRNALGHFLSRHGFQILKAENGKEALLHDFENKIDLVLLEIEMPILNGFETAKNIRDQKTALELPILFLSGANKDIFYKYKGLELGINDYLTYPYDEEELLFKIKSLLKVNKEVKESNVKFKAIFNNMADGIMIIKKNNRKVKMVNNQLCQMIGYSKEEIEKFNIPEDLHFEKDLSFALERYNQLMEKEISFTENIPVKRKDNSVFFANLSSTWMTMNEEEYMIVNIKDSSDRYKYMKRLHSQFESMETIIDSLPFSFYVINAQDYTIETANSHFRAIMKKNKGKNTCYELTHNRDTPCVGEHPCPLELVKKWKKSVTVEHIHYHMDEPRIIEVHGHPIFNKNKDVIQMIEHSMDITERKNVEKELKIRNEINQVFLSVADDKIYSAILNILLAAFNSPYGLFGYINEKGLLVVPSMTRHIWKNCDIPYKEEVFSKHSSSNSSWSRALREKRTIFSNIESGNIPEGHIAIKRYISTPIFYKNEVIGLLQVANKETDYNELDIKLMDTIASHIAPILFVRLVQDRLKKEKSFELEERKKAERALGISEWKFKSLVECSTTGIIIVKSNRIIFANRSASKITGYTTKELLDKNFSEVFIYKKEQDWEDFLNEISITKVYSINNEQSKEYRFAGKDGSLGWWKLHSIELALDLDISFLVDIVDITKMKETQTQLLQKEKMSTIGEIAAGVAHEINNPLSYIMSNLRVFSEYFETIKTFFQIVTSLSNSNQNLKDQLVNEDIPFIMEDMDALLPETIDGVKKISSIVNDIKSFARMDEDEIEKTDINQIIKSTLNIIWNLIKYDCKINTTYSEDLPLMKCNARQLTQVFMNIIINSKDAILEKKALLGNDNPYEGIIEISTEYENGKDGKVPKEIEIKIKDNGSGIPDSVKSKIFNPFFTTKEEGTGTGLGLSISLDIVQKHGGNLFLESRKGEGTTFKIYLPVE